MSETLHDPNREAMKLMVATIRQSSEAFMLADPAGRFVYVNPAFSKLFGYSAEQLQGKKVSILAPHEAGDMPGAAAFAMSVDAADRPAATVRRIRARSGHDIAVVLHCTLLTAEDGASLGSATSMTSLSDLLKSEEQLWLAASIFKNAYDGVIITDVDGRILDVNPAFTRITGYAREEVLGRNPRFLQSGRQGREFYAAMWDSLLHEGYFRGELWNRRKDGNCYAEVLTIFAVRDEAGQTRQYLGIINDITAVKTQTRELERLAHIDCLTGLPNRLLLSQHLEQATEQARRTGKRYAVCFIDLDGFKAINDTHGHHVGDEVLIAISRRLVECVREGDTIARLGGDEFVAVLTHLEDRMECERTLRRLLTIAADPIAVGKLELKVSVSLGVALFPDDSTEPETLLRWADQSMYAAKHAGRNRYCFYSDTCCSPKAACSR